MRRREMKEYKRPTVEIEELSLGDCSLGNLCSGVTPGNSLGTSTGSGETGIYDGPGGIFG